MSSVFTAASSFYHQVLRSASPKRMSVVVVIVLGFLATMAWTQVQEKEQYLIQRNFRLLNLWSNDISQKIASYEKILKTTLDGAVTHLRHDEHHSTVTQIQKPDLGRKRLVRRLGSKAGGATTLSALQNFSGKCHEGFAKAQRKSNDESKEFHDLIRDFKRLCEAEGLEEVSVTKVKNHDSEIGLKILTRQSPPMIQLTYTKSNVEVGSSVNKTSPSEPETPLTGSIPGEITLESGQDSEAPTQTRVAIEATGTINLQTFLDRLWRHQIYDEILLFEKQKPEEEKSLSLIYHSGASGMPWRSFQELKEYRVTETFGGTLFSSKEKSTGEDAISLQDKHFRISIPGQAFQVFTQPIRFPGNDQEEWMLVGLVQQEKFLNSSLAISSTLLLGMMFLLLGLVLAIPLFHLKTMGPKDPLRPIHVLGLVLSALLGAGFVTFLILDISVYFNGKGELRDRLSESAQNIKEEMFAELKSVLETLSAFDRNMYLKNDYAEILNAASTENIVDKNTDSNDNFQVTQATETLEVGRRPVLLEENISLKDLKAFDRVGEQDPYTDFLYAFWMDHDGSLRINWARDEFQGKPVHGMTQNFSLHKRDYVRRAIDSPDKLWQFRNESSLSPFFLEPIFSWTTGLNTVVASMKSQLEHPKGKDWVAAIEFKFKSLMDQIVLPPGIGLAVINNADKMVLFHSDEWRNLREPFLVETDDNPMLQDLLSAKTAGHAEGSYWGKPHSFFLLPLDPIPWSLVVFRDMEMLKSMNLVGLLIAGFLYSLWAFLVYLALWIFLRRQKNHRRAPWLWPDKNKHITFSILCVANVALFAMLMVMIIAWWDTPSLQMTVAWLIPLAWVFFSVGSFLKLKPQSFSAEKKGWTSWASTFFSQWSYPQSYSLMLTSFLLILAVAPAFACFSAVFNQDMKLFGQYQLLQLVQTFQDSPLDNPFLKHLKDNCLLKSATNTSFAYDGFPGGVYPEFYSKIRPSCESLKADAWQKNLRKSRDRTNFQKAFTLVSQPFSPLIKHASLLGFIADSWPDNAKTERNLWGSDGRQITLQHLITEHKNNDELRILSFSTDLPFIAWFAKDNFPTFEEVLSLHETPLEQYMVYGILSGIFLVILYFYLYTIPKFIANRVLFLSYNTPNALMPSPLFASKDGELTYNRFVIGFPSQGKTSMALKEYEITNQKHSEESKEKEESPRSQQKTLAIDPRYFDLNACPPDKWKDELSKQISSLELKGEQDFHMTIDHLDRQWKDPAINLKKLELMEWLLNRSNHNNDTSKPSAGKSSSENSQNSKLGDLVMQVLTKIVSQEKS